MDKRSMTRTQLLEALEAAEKCIEELEATGMSDQGRMRESQARRERYRHFFNLPQLGTAIVGPDGNWVEISDEVCRILQYSREELQNISWRDLMPGDSLPEGRFSTRAVLDRTIRAGITEMQFIRKDGSQVDIQASAMPIRGEDGAVDYIVAVIQDITGRKQSDRLLNIQSELAFALTKATSVHEAAEFCLGACIRATECDSGGIYLLDDDSRALNLVHVQGVSDTFAERVRQYAGSSAGTRIVLDGRTLYFDAADLLSLFNGDDLTAEGIRSVGIFPIRHLDRIIGNLNVASHVFDTISEFGRKALEAIASQIGSAIARLLAEQKLRESEELFRLLFEKSDDANLFMLGDRYIECNEAALRIAGCPDKSLLLRLTPAEISPERQPDGALSSEKAMRMIELANWKGSHRFEWVRRKLDGGEVHLDVMLTAVSVKGKKLLLTTWRDITERKRAENELRESQRRLSDIIEFLPDATLVIDREGKIIAWNRAIEVMTGLPKEEMLGKGGNEYSIPFYGDRRPILIDLALRPDSEIEGKYTSIQRAGDILFGESFTPALPPGNKHLSATASVLRDSRGEVIAAIECIRDNTERKRLEERLNRAEKMEALGTLAGGVAHDLNNVLGVLVGYSELLLGKLPEESPLRRYAENILNSGERGAAIIQDLLTLARRGVTISEVLDLNGVVADYLRSPELEKLKNHHTGVTIRTELEDGLLNVKGSPVHLTKTLMNLVSNAVESISGDGEVTIRTKNRYLDCSVRGYDEMKEGDYAVLSVSDTGRGISSTDLGKIFEPFYTKKVMGRSGTGLGLAVVWGTVKDHAGYIDVRSAEGQGSVFTLYFPVTREALKGKQMKAQLDQYQGRGETILVVDDVEGQRNLAVSMLSQLNYRVEAVSSGEAAVEYIRERPADLLLLDMIMDPGIDGLETYRRILKINPRQRAVIISGFSETDRVRKAQESGAGGYVRKPYTLERIGLAIREELSRKAGR
ncbi:MAG: PAS domain S-box protein [Syntrophaceae bacterium]|nr:PAS domain S-box protein [Syntrophaceae bacterium]